MRGSARLSAILLTFIVLGGLAALYLSDDARFEAMDELPRVALVMLALLGCLIVPVFLLMNVVASRGRARLLAGRDVIARWHVTAAEWDRFRKVDETRAAEGEGRLNDMTIRKETPGEGVDVIVGKHGLLVDGSYHVLRRGGLPALQWVGWLTADPECVEFYVLYPKGRFGGTYGFTLRVPVSPRNRDDAIRVYEHYRAIIPPPGKGLAFRYPGRTIGGGLVVAALFGVVGLVGYAMWDRGDDTAAFVMMLGLLGGIFALFFTVVIALVVQPWRQR